MIGILTNNGTPFSNFSMKNYKYTIELFNGLPEYPYIEKVKSISFGAKGYEDYTTHKDKDRKKELYSET